MILTAREDIDAPIESVFNTLTDLPAFERMALRRGVKLKRTETGSGRIEKGASWQLKAKYRGKVRAITMTIAEVEAPVMLGLTSSVGGIDAQTRIELLQMSRGSTRMSVRTKLQPTSLSGRLMVQSLKLTRGAIERKYQKRITQFAGMIGDRANIDRA
ncbi:MAG: hypothetical protein CSA72_12810 [Rhodobacterales bacterium]|nr:MAG: hypothetical protein CSA72_12810 [Rhodobacterales bacterium]